MRHALFLNIESKVTRKRGRNIMFKEIFESVKTKGVLVHNNGVLFLKFE